MDKASLVYNFMQLKKQLPTAVQSFPELRSAHKRYVDKTLEVYMIAADSVPKFLSRPRRFGKSTIVSTLDELFRHGVKPYDGHDSYFKDLAIEKIWDDEGKYDVLRLDFSKFELKEHLFADFKRDFLKVITDFADRIGISLAEKEDAAKAFLELVEKAQMWQLVFLLDEYDAPLIAYYQTKESQETAAFMRSIFNTIKVNKEKFRCVFVTGITRYKEAYLLTAGSSFTDISLKEEFSTICGYTREEIREVFKEHLDYAAAKTFDVPYEAVTCEQRESILNSLASWYDGYCFDEKCSQQVFSTWSVLGFFDSMGASFKRYWYDTAGLQTILLKAFSKTDYRKMLGNFSHGCLSVGQDAFLNPSSYEKMDPNVLLYQCGYLTLAEPISYLSVLSPVKLRLPNTEIGSAFAGMLASALNSSTERNKIFERCAKKISQAISNQDPQALMQELNLLFQTFDYEGTPIDSEASVTVMMQIFIFAMFPGSEVAVNVHEAGGRADLIFKEANTKVVVENKFVRDHDPQKLDAALHQALEQIRTHHYGQTLRYEDQLWRVGLVFCGKSRRLERAGDADEAGEELP